jgi:hypothetical protein
MGFGKLPLVCRHASWIRDRRCQTIRAGQARVCDAILVVVAFRVWRRCKMRLGARKSYLRLRAINMAALWAFRRVSLHDRSGRSEPAPHVTPYRVFSPRLQAIARVIGSGTGDGEIGARGLRSGDALPPIALRNSFHGGQNETPTQRKTVLLATS